MVGKITVQPVNVCCQRVFTVVKSKYRNNTPSMDKVNSFSKLQRIFSKNVFIILFTFLFLFLIFVLYITNQKPVYKHTDLKTYDEHLIHDEHYSKFHYGVVIDCGSSGSRVYIYYWPPHSGSKEELLDMKQMIDIDGNPVRLKIKPGISSFADNPSNASMSLRPLLQFASHHVPHSKHHETPLYILATAGMRLLPAMKRKNIIKNIEQQIPKMTEFFFTKSQVEVITGKQEGIYLWIATNYMLGRFDHSHDVSTTPASTVSHVIRKQTVGTIEIGGASLQIAYEVPQNETLSSDLGAYINLGCDTHQIIHEYQIYVTTFLGLGTDFGRKSYISSVYERNKDKIKSHEVVEDPCLPTDMVDDQIYDNEKFKLTGTGQFNQCENNIKPLLNLSSTCTKPPCSFNGIHQPPIDYAQAEFYGFAEFWYSSNDVLRVGGKYENAKLEKEAKSFCETRWSIHKRHYAMGLYPKADDFRFKYQCFKSAWVTTVLHDGLNFPKDYDGLTTVQMIKGKELQWTLGALLYRTRFLPLRDMELENAQSAKAQQHGWWIIILHEGFYPILFTLACIVIMLVVIYCRRLRHFSLTANTYPRNNYAPISRKAEPYDIRVDM